jgi:hypothetical protein
MTQHPRSASRRIDVSQRGFIAATILSSILHRPNYKILSQLDALELDPRTLSLQSSMSTQLAGLHAKIRAAISAHQPVKLLLWH